MTYRPARSLVALALLPLVLAPAGFAAAQDKPAPSRPAQADAPARERFDNAVRADFFKGLLEKDKEAWERARKTVADALAKDPNDGQVLAWKGSMTVNDAGDAFRAGDFNTGTKLWAEGLATMDRGVDLDKGTLLSRIPRGVTLVTVYKYEMDQAKGRKMLETGAADLRESLKQLEPFWGQQSEHSKGEMLTQLAAAEDALGNKAEAKALWERTLKELPGTRYAKRAEAALKPAQ